MANALRSGNPVLRDSTLEKAIERTHDGDGVLVERMTLEGTINKSFILLGLLLITSLIGFMYASTTNIIVGAIGGLIAVLVCVFKPTTARYSAPIYALFEGLFIGSISAFYASFVNGIVLQAVGLTFGTLFIMLMIYRSGLIKVTQKFRMGVVMATGAIFLLYLASFVLSFFGIYIPYLHEGGWIGIGISLVIIVVASLNLLLDFDNIEEGIKHGAPIYIEWYCAMGLLVTLVWLYLEFLRLLSMLQRN